MRTHHLSEDKKIRVLNAVYKWREYAIHATGNEQAAQDLMHDIFYKMCRNRKGLPEDSQELMRIAYTSISNALVDRYRIAEKQKTRTYVAEYDDTDLNPCDDGYRRLNSRDRLAQVRAILHDDRFYIPLMLFAEGYTTYEIRDILKLKMNTVLSRIHQARRKLKKEMP